MTDFKCGYVALIGLPNVGKSTLLNKLVGEKLAITSPKPQTTRHRLLGIVNRPGAQLLYLDTPGILEPKGPLNQTLVAAALSALAAKRFKYTTYFNHVHSKVSAGFQ